MDHRQAALAEVEPRYTAVLWIRQEIAALESLSNRSERGESANMLLGLLAQREKRLDEILRLCSDMKIDQQMQDLEMRHADRLDLIVHTLIANLKLDAQEPWVRQAMRTTLDVIEGGAG